MASESRHRERALCRVPDATHFAAVEIEPLTREPRFKAAACFGEIQATSSSPQANGNSLPLRPTRYAQGNGGTRVSEELAALRYRSHAEELRAIAADLPDLCTGRTLLKIADDYDHLASSREANRARCQAVRFWSNYGGAIVSDIVANK